jgi:DNA-binding IclR family transcriptional regulator
MHVIAHYDASAPMRSIEKHIGNRFPMFGSCMGAAWLSTQTDETVQTAVRLCRRELGRWATNVSYILERVQLVRKQGYAYGGCGSLNDDSRRGVSVPLPPSPEGLVLVIGTYAPPSTFTKTQSAEIARLMKKTMHQCIESEVRQHAA